MVLPLRAKLYPSSDDPDQQNPATRTSKAADNSAQIEVLEARVLYSVDIVSSLAPPADASIEGDTFFALSPISKALEVSRNDNSGSEYSDEQADEEIAVHPEVMAARENELVSVLSSFSADDEFAANQAIAQDTADQNQFEIQKRSVLSVVQTQITTPGTIEVNEDESYTPQITVVQTGDPNAAVTVILSVTNGALTIGQTSGVEITEDDPAKPTKITLIGTQADVNNALTSLTYQADENFHGTDVLTIAADNSVAATITSDNTDITERNEGRGQPISDLFVDDPDRGEILSLANGDHVAISGRLGDPQEITFSAWVNLEESGTSGAELFNLGDVVGLRLDSDGTYLQGFFYHEPSGDWLPTQTQLVLADPVGQNWQHVAYVIEDGSQRLYHNGVLAAETNHSTGSMGNLIDYNTDNATQETTIGVHSRFGFNDYHFTGDIDNALIYNRALSSDEILNLESEQPLSGETIDVSINVLAVNDPPVLSDANSTGLQTISNTSSFSEGGDPTSPLNTTILVSDIEATVSGTYNGTSLSLHRTFATADAPGPLTSPNAFDVFSSTIHGALAENSNIAHSTATGIAIGEVTKNSDGELLIVFNDNATAEEINTLMQSIQYSNTSNFPSTGVTLTWTFSDAGADNDGTQFSAQEEIATATTIVNISTVDQIPVVTTNNTTFLPFGGTTIIGPDNLTASDPDAFTEDLRYRIEIFPAHGSLKLNGVTLTPNNTFTGEEFHFTQEDINNDRLTYTANSIPGTAPVPDSFRFKVSSNGTPIFDNADIVIGGTSQIIPPTLTDVTDPLTTTLEDTPVELSFAQLAANSDAEDLDGTVSSFIITSVASGTLTLGPSQATASPFSATNNAINNSINAYWKPDTNVSGIFSAVTIVATDNQGTRSAQDVPVNINVTPVNDPPAGKNATFTVNENAVHTFSAADFGFSDTDSNSFTSVEIVSLPEVGTLLNSDGTAVAVNDSVSSASLSDLEYRPGSNPGNAASASFIFQVKDDGGTANGGIDTDPTNKTITFNINDVNTAPVGSNSQITVLEDGSLNFTAADFVFTDQDSHGLASIEIVALPVKGSLTLSGANVTAGMTIEAADLDDLVFTPNANENGTDYSSFGFKIRDDGGTDNGGLDTDVTPNFIIIDVLAVNDAPEGIDKTIIVSEHSSFSFSPADFGYTDIEADNRATVTITSLPSVGTLLLPKGPVFEGEVINAGQLANLEYQLISADGTTSADFGFRIQDTGGVANGGIDTDSTDNTITINILDFNLAPAGTDKTVQIFEDTDFRFTAADFGFTDQDSDTFTAVVINSLPVNGSLALSGVSVVTGQFLPISAIGDLVYSPPANATGTESFTFRVQDNGGVANGGSNISAVANVFTLDILPVNDAPSGTDATFSVNENGAHTFSATDFGFSDTDPNSFATVKIISSPSVGTLFFDGTPITDNQTINAGAIPNIVYLPGSNPGAVSNTSFDFQVQDTGGTANGGVDTDPTFNTVTFNLNDVNNAPQGTDNLIVIDEDSSYVFAASDFGFSDQDAHQLAAIEIVSLPAIGSLSLSGSSVVAGQSIDAANLPDLVYTPVADTNGVLYSSFAFKVRDDGGTLNAGSNTAATENFITFDVLGVNDAPQGIDKSLDVKEHSNLSFIAADFGYTDIESDNRATVTITSLPSVGTLLLSGTPVTIGDVINAGQIANLDYQLSSAGSTTSANFDFLIQDTGGTANGGIDTDPVANTITLNILNVNLAPVGTDNTIQINEDNSQTFSAADFGFTDPDSDNLIAVQITSLPLSGELTLSGIPVFVDQFVPATSLNSLAFTPDANTNGADSFTFKVQDSGGVANGGSDTDAVANVLSLNVLPVNDAPSGTDRVFTINENGVHTFSVTDFGFTDTDLNSFNTVKIVSLPTLGILTFSGTPVSVNQSINASAISDIEYLPGSNPGAASSTSFDFQVQDSGGTANGGVDTDPTRNTVTFNLNDVNNAPQGSNNLIVLNEDSSHTFTDTDFGFSDEDAHGLAAIEIVSIPATGRLSLSGADVVAGQSIDTADLPNLVYTPVADTNGAPYTSFAFKVQDDGGTENAGSDTATTESFIRFDVVSINDAPTGTDTSISLIEDTNYVLSDADFGFTDPKDQNKLLSVTIDTIPANGNLTLAGTPILPGTNISLAEINSGALVFSTDSNTHGSAYAVIDFRVQDDGGTASGGTDLATTTNTLTFNVAPVNDMPQGNDNTLFINEDQNYTFSTADFGFSDSTDVGADINNINSGDNFLFLQLASVPANGSLQLSGVTLTSGAQVAAADITDNRLAYTPASDTTGVESFTFFITDDGGTTNNGINTDSTANTINIIINAVNDGPTGTSTDNIIIEDSSHTFTRADFGFLDTADNHNFTNVIVENKPANGSLTLQGADVESGDIINVSLIDTGNLVFTPLTDEHGADYANLTFSVQDDGGTANGGIDTDQQPDVWSVDVLSVNDSPGGTDSGITINEDSTVVLSTADFGFSDPRDNNNLQAVYVDALSGTGTLSIDNSVLSTPAIISATDIAAGKLAYTPVENQQGNQLAQITFRVEDDGGTANGGVSLSPLQNVLSINVLGINDSPEGIDTIVNLQEDTPYQFTTIDFAFTDIENHSLQSVTIDSLPANGTLTIDGTAITAGSSIDANQIALGRLFFQPAPDFTGISSFDFSVQDDGGVSNQGSDTDLLSNTLTLNVAPVSDAPAGIDATAAVNDDENYTLTRNDFQFTDIENDSLGGVTIDSLPASGSLTIAGTQVNAGDFIDIADIDAGNLLYTPDNNSGILQSAFSFSVADTGSNTGVTADPDPNTLTFDINQINDQPDIVADRLRLPEGSTVSETSEGNLSLLDNDNDADNDSLTTELITPPQHGQFELFSDGTFRYVHDGSETTTDSVTYQISDGTNTQVTTLQIDITPVNDSPVSTALDNQTITTDLPFSINLPANSFTDPDPQDSLTITASLANGDALPEGISFDAETLTFSGTATESNNLSIVLTATDQDGLAATAAFDITVEPALAAAIEIDIEPVVEVEPETSASEEPEPEVIVETETEESQSDNTSFELSDNATAPLAPGRPTPAAPPSIAITAPATEVPIFRDFDRLTRAVEVHRQHSVQFIQGSDSVIAVQKSPSLADLFLTDTTKSLNNSDLSKKLDQEREQLEQGLTLDTRVVGSAVSVSTGLSIGYVIWLVRGGLLLGSVMSSLPAWRNIDPLPVLSTLDDNSDGSDDDSLEELVEKDDRSKSEPESKQGQDN